MQLLGFGCEFLDVDCDGDKDLLVANGHVRDTVADLERGVSYAERKSLYRNDGKGQFTDITDRKEVENAIRQANDRLNFLFSSGPGVIFTCKL